MGTVIVSIILILIITCIILSMVKAKRKGQHPSCGGHCSSCAGACQYRMAKENN